MLSFIPLFIYHAHLACGVFFQLFVNTPEWRLMEFDLFWFTHTHILEFGVIEIFVFSFISYLRHFSVNSLTEGGE